MLILFLFDWASEKTSLGQRDEEIQSAWDNLRGTDAATHGDLNTTELLFLKRIGMSLHGGILPTLGPTRVMGNPASVERSVHVRAASPLARQHFGS